MEFFYYKALTEEQKKIVDEKAEMIWENEDLSLSMIKAVIEKLKEKIEKLETEKK